MSDVFAVHPAEVRPYIYGNTYPYVDAEEIDSIGYSLTLVHVSSLTISQTINFNGQSKTKASFIYNGKWYSDMSVTNSDFFHHKMEQDLPTHTLLLACRTHRFLRSATIDL